LLALLVQSFAPAYARLAGGAGGGSSIVICTAHGFQTVRVDADGNALTGKSSANAQDCCTDCQAAGGFVVPTPVRVPTPSHIASDEPVFGASPRLTLRFFSSYVTRGPPLLVI
jgi:hypothetical protein